MPFLCIYRGSKAIFTIKSLSQFLHTIKLTAAVVRVELFILSKELLTQSHTPHYLKSELGGLDRSSRSGRSNKLNRLG